MKVWIDADACPRPVKDILFRAAVRRKVHMYVVANHSMHVPRSVFLHQVLVSQGFDVADHYIVQHLEASDLVITADVPLADLVVETGAVAISPRGTLFDAETIKERLSVRNFMQDLRDTGVQTGGPRSFGEVEKRRFAAVFDRVLSQRMRGL